MREPRRHPSNEVIRAPPEKPVAYTRVSSVHTIVATCAITSATYITSSGRPSWTGTFQRAPSASRVATMNRSLSANVSKPLVLAWPAEDPPLPCRSRTSGNRICPSYPGGTNNRYTRCRCPDVSGCEDTPAARGRSQDAPAPLRPCARASPAPRVINTAVITSAARMSFPLLRLAGLVNSHLLSRARFPKSQTCELGIGSRPVIAVLYITGVLQSEVLSAAGRNFRPHRSP